MTQVREFVLSTWKDENEINTFLEELDTNGDSLVNILYSKSDNKTGVLVVYEPHVELETLEAKDVKLKS